MYQPHNVRLVSQLGINFLHDKVFVKHGQILLKVKIFLDQSFLFLIKRTATLSKAVLISLPHPLPPDWCPHPLRVSPAPELIMSPSSPSLRTGPGIVKPWTGSVDTVSNMRGDVGRHQGLHLAPLGHCLGIPGAAPCPGLQMFSHRLFGLLPYQLHHAGPGLLSGLRLELFPAFQDFQVLKFNEDAFDKFKYISYLNIRGIERYFRELTGEAVLERFLQGDSLVTKINPANESLEEAKTSTVQTDPAPDPVLAHGYTMSLALKIDYTSVIIIPIIIIIIELAMIIVISSIVIYILFLVLIIFVFITVVILIFNTGFLRCTGITG